MRVNAFSSVLYVTLVLSTLVDVVAAYRGRSAFSRRGFPFFGDGMFGEPKREPSKGGFMPFPPSFSPPGRPPAKKPSPAPSKSQPTNPQPTNPQPSNPQPSNPPPSNPLSLDNIQGDILFPIDSSTKTFFFFKIVNPTQFKQQLTAGIHDRITTAAQASDSSKLPSIAVNMGFTVDGLNLLGTTDDLGDRSFKGGQINDVSAMGDPGTNNWAKAFTTPKNIHGVFIIAANSADSVNSEIQNILSALKGSISEQYRLAAAMRPNDQAGHEHFGFKDGLSQPCVDGFTSCRPGQTLIPPGVLIIGANGDNTPRPSWAAGGSMMAFRQLQQLVPEFNNFLNDNAIMMPGFSRAQGADFLGARMFGRWKDGTPLDLSPSAPDPSLAADPMRNNNFTFAHQGEDLSSNQLRCPFSAHIRKTNPRADFNPENNRNHIMRSSIAYGPEVTSDESSSGKTNQNRGLAFVSYQSLITDGFLFQQQSWADLTRFPFNKNESAGFDAIIGANQGKPHQSFGLDPRNVSKPLSIPDFVVSNGGAYFFFPPLSAMASGGKLAQS